MNSLNGPNSSIDSQNLLYTDLNNVPVLMQDFINKVSDPTNNFEYGEHFKALRFVYDPFMNKVHDLNRFEDISSLRLNDDEDTEC